MGVVPVLAKRVKHHCLVYRLLVFVKITVAVWISKKGGSYFEFCKVNCVNGRSDNNGFN